MSTTSSTSSFAVTYTAIQAPRSQATSEHFVQYGIHGEVAAPISMVAVSAASRAGSLQGALFHLVLAATVQAYLLNTSSTLTLGPVFASTLRADDKVKSIFPFPETVTSFGQHNLKESIAAKMTGIGFRKDSVGKRTYYRGPGTLENIKVIVGLNGEMDTYAPFGACNIYGISAMRIILKILLTSYGGRLV